MKFFTSDLHLYHVLILDYVDRKCDNVDQMHQQLIRTNNEVVGKKDELWAVGDVSLTHPEDARKVRNVISKFNGLKHLVLGNHDEWKVDSYLKSEFITVHSAMWFEHKGITFYMVHDPAAYTVIENIPNAVLLCGHVHKLFKHLLPHKRVINVGVDVWKNPPSMLDIEALLIENDLFNKELG